MLKRLITKLYNKYCEKEAAFEIKRTILTKEEARQIYIESKLILDNGHLQKVIDMVFAESEHKQLYRCSNNPMSLTEAQLEAERRGGIEDLVNKLREFARKANEEKEKEFDSYEAI